MKAMELGGKGTLPVYIEDYALSVVACGTHLGGWTGVSPAEQQHPESTRVVLRAEACRRVCGSSLPLCSAAPSGRQ